LRLNNVAAEAIHEAKIIVHFFVLLQLKLLLGGEVCFTLLIQQFFNPLLNT
jgi:hypothetical protein